MTPLGALVEEVRDSFLNAHGVELTYGDIARRSGGRLTRQRVQQLAKDEVKELPGPEKIAGLARGLGVPDSIVLERALSSAGYEVPRGWGRSEDQSATAIDPAARAYDLARYQRRADQVADRENSDAARQIVPERRT